MNLVTTFLNTNLAKAMPYIGGFYVTWKEQSLQVIQNGHTKNGSLMVGGINPDGDNTTILIPHASFTGAPRPAKGDLIVDWNELEWLVDTIDVGESLVTLVLHNRKKRSNAR